MASERPWYDAAFEADYLALYPLRDLAAARFEAGALIERGLRGVVLDLGCGFGRHVLALRERGLEAFGLDRSLDLLAHAHELEGGVLRGRLVRGDSRALPFRERVFDGVVLLFSSFGYFEDDENACVLGECARVLKPGGVLVLDLMNPARVRATLVPESRSERGGMVLVERRSLARDGRRVRKEVTLTRADGSGRSWREDVRLYEAAEVAALLAAAGLEHLRSEGDFDGVDSGPETPRQIVWARRRAPGA
jgi:SAM-dependent methyltransferase